MKKRPSQMPNPRFASVVMLLFFLATDHLPAGRPDGVIRFTGQSVTLGEVMDRIRSQTGVTFVFDSRTLDTSLTIALDPDSYRLSQAMDLIAANTGYTYMIKGDYVVINSTPKQAQAIKAPQKDPHYVPSDPTVSEDIWTERPAVAPAAADAPGESAVSDTPAVREYPAPYSVYSDPDIYGPIPRRLPHLAVKTNLLYGGAAFTPNLSGELGLSPQITMEIGGSWNRFNRTGSAPDDNKKLNHWILRAEVRRWFCQRYDGHFAGVHAFYSEYNIGGHNLPLLFRKKYRYEGTAYGAGITYGYHFPLAKRWGVELHAGAGAARLKYDKFDCTPCGDVIEKRSKIYFGPTRAGINIVFLIK